MLRERAQVNAVAREEATRWVRHRAWPTPRVYGRRFRERSREAIASVSVVTIQSLKLRSSSAATRFSATQRLVGIRVVSLWLRGS
jgi:hypothetical protein